MTVILFPGVPVSDDVSTPARRCVGPHRRDHQATVGLLCDDHYQELGRWLHDIQDEVERLSAVPRLESAYDGGGSAKIASHRSPAVDDVIAMTDHRTTAHGYRHHGPVCAVCPSLLGFRCTCPPGATRRRVAHWEGCPRRPVHPSCESVLADRDEWTGRGAASGREIAGGPKVDDVQSILEVLHGWAQRVRDERKLEPPAGEVLTALRGPWGVVGEWRHTVTIGPTVSSERRVLSRHLDWICAQPWVADMRHELGTLRSKLLRLNRNEEAKPLSGWCIRIVDKKECGGNLWPAEPLHTSGFETKSGLRAVVCQKDDSHRWEDRDLPFLLAALDLQRRKDTAS